MKIYLLLLAICGTAAASRPINYAPHFHTMVGPEAKSEAKSEAKLEAKLEADSEAKSEAKSETKPETHATLPARKFPRSGYDSVKNPFLFSGISPPSPALKAEKRLERFVRHLQTFINESYYDISGFEMQLSDLQTGLHDIQSSVSVCHYKELNDKLDFAHHMFWVMVDSARNLRLQAGSYDWGSHITACIVQLNVRMLDLFDASGVPDPRIDGYKRIVAVHAAHLRVWNGLFRKLRDVPAKVVATYVDQYQRAAETLQTLASHVAS